MKIFIVTEMYDEDYGGPTSNVIFASSSKEKAIAFLEEAVKELNDGLLDCYNFKTIEELKKKIDYCCEKNNDYSYAINAADCWYRFNLKEFVVDEKENDDIIATIKWHKDDLKQILFQNGYEPNDENIENLLNNTRIKQTLIDRSTEEGWNILEDIIKIKDKNVKVAPLKNYFVCENCDYISNNAIWCDLVKVVDSEGKELFNHAVKLQVPYINHEEGFDLQIFLNNYREKYDISEDCDIYLLSQEPGKFTQKDIQENKFGAECCGAKCYNCKYLIQNINKIAEDLV